MSAGNYKSDLCDIEVDIVHTTDRAVLIHDGNREVWLALSHIEVERIGPGRRAIVTLPEWLATEKELV